VSKQEEKRRESVSNYHLVVLGKLYLKLKKDSEHIHDIKVISKKKNQLEILNPNLFLNCAKLNHYILAKKCK
jgi:hypothetical protein